MEENIEKKTKRPPFSFFWRDLLRCEDKKKAALYTILGFVIVALISLGLLSLKNDIALTVRIIAMAAMGLDLLATIANLLVLLFIRDKHYPALITGLACLLTVNITGGIYTLAASKAEFNRPEYKEDAPETLTVNEELFLEKRPEYQEGYDKDNDVIIRVVSKKKKTKPYQVKGIEDVSAKNNWKGWLYLAPVIILVAVFLIYPLISTIFISFTSNYNYQTGSFDQFTFRNFTYILGLTTKSAVNDAREVYFTKYAILQEPTLQDSVWNQMILGQHHGLPTRLLDWSFSPIIALHFATTENDLEMMDAHDAVVWRIDIHELHAMLPEKYRACIRKYNTTVFSVNMIREVCNSLKQYDEDMQDNCMVIIEPPSLDPRIVNQYSFFSVIPDKMVDITGFLDRCTDLTCRFVIKKELRWRIRDMLDHQNITERIVYPGLDGLSHWLGRHYFVRD